jgi:hypothetical protein
MAAAGGQDDQRLVGQVTQGGRLLHRGRRLAILLDRAAKRAWVASLARTPLPGPRRQATPGEPGGQAAQTQPSRGRTQDQDTAQAALAPLASQCWPRVRRRRRGGGLHQHHAGDLLGIASGEGAHLQATNAMTGQHIAPGTWPRRGNLCRSVATWAPSWAVAAGSLHPRPARSSTPTRGSWATAGAITQLRGQLTGARLQHHAAHARASAGPGGVRPIEQPPPGIGEVLASAASPGLVAAADQGQHQQRDHRIQQPASESALRLPLDPHEPPDGQPQHEGGHPQLSTWSTGAPKLTRSSPPSQAQGRRRGPALG